ncbi:hypothetical protein B0H16DRAFT_1739975 [Mycena metata]|uniref:Uncharacterized protein n=1 Tax=Mycena metata TaxID=1033252 RepID=A0AAD7HEL3_9AGAR|nr:hypothetical protein B0H16DRAFT_1739975 [Mycena metata]
MSTLSQIYTFLKAHFGAVLSHFLAFFSRRSTEVKPDVEATLADPDTIDSDFEKSESLLGHDTPSDDFSFLGESITSAHGTEPLSAVVAVDLEVLPSMPSIFKFPAIRPPVDAPALTPHRQDFGQPSGLYYDRRFPFGNVTNVLRNDLNTTPMKLQTQVLPRKPKGKSKHVRTRNDVNWSLPTGVPHGRRSRSKNARPLLAPEIPVEQIVDCRPQGLSTIAEDATHGEPVPIHNDLQDLLSTLVRDATDTLAGLDGDEVNESRKDTSEQGAPLSGDKQVPRPRSPSLISSISASRSMAALASASSRSLGDLLDSFDDLMTSPRWRRVLSRSDVIARRNDSVV